MTEPIRVCFDRILQRDLYRPLVITGNRSLRAIGVKKTFWPNGSLLRIAFLEGDPEKWDIVENSASQWLKHANLKFKFVADPQKAEIRIGFQPADGSWSALGTDSLEENDFPKSARTMNFGWLDEAVVLHEFGHAIGLGHEHSNPEGGIPWNEPVVIEALKGPPNYWSEKVTRHNVLKKYSLNQTVGTGFDPDSIMLYFFPPEWTLNGKGTHENEVLSKQDKMFIACEKAYPKFDGAQDDLIVNLDIDAPKVTAASIGQPGEEDLFQFKVKESGYYTVSTHGETDLIMRLFGPDHRTKLLDEDDDSGQDFNARITRQLESGEYLVQIRHANPRTGVGEYGVSVKSY